MEGRIKLRQCQRPVGNLVYVRGIASALDQDAGLDRPAVCFQLFLDRLDHSIDLLHTGRIRCDMFVYNRYNLNCQDLAGVPPEALHLYHQFTSEENHVIPKQTKPAIRRRRGESAIDWLAVGK